MMPLDKKTLPRLIKKRDLPNLVCESVSMYCPACGKRITTKVQPGGILVCPVCGGEPDWDTRGHKPSIAYESRYQRVVDLCAEDSPWHKWADAVEQRYSDFIEATYCGMPTQTKKNGWRYFADAWKELDKLGDYLLEAPDVPEMDLPTAYGEKGLKRRRRDSRRDCIEVSFSELGIEPKYDDGGTQYTISEAVELLAYDPADCCKYMDEYFKYWFLENIENPLERDIAYWLSAGEGKRDIEKMYGLSEQQVRTICKHLKNILDKKSLKTA